MSVQVKPQNAILEHAKVEGEEYWECCTLYTFNLFTEHDNGTGGNRIKLARRLKSYTIAASRTSIDPSKYLVGRNNRAQTRDAQDEDFRGIELHMGCIWEANPLQLERL